MMKFLKYVFLLPLLVFCSSISSVFCQDTAHKYLKEQGTLMLGLHSYDTIQDSYSAFSDAFIKILKSTNSFQDKFDSLDFISFLYPPDSSFRIMSWQANIGDSKFVYKGVIQTKDTLYILQAKPAYFNHPDFANLELNPDNWYTCLYYGMEAFQRKKHNYYLLFGYQQPNAAIKRKVMDVFWFDGKKPVFGKELLCNKKTDHCSKRMMIEYAANATARLNYDKEYKMVVYDHLIKGVNPDFKDVMTYMPDGSYEGYKLKKNGTWEYDEMVWHDIQATPPTDLPPNTEKKKDIFGR